MVSIQVYTKPGKCRGRNFSTGNQASRAVQASEQVWLRQDFLSSDLILQSTEKAYEKNLRQGCVKDLSASMIEESLKILYIYSTTWRNRTADEHCLKQLYKLQDFKSFSLNTEQHMLLSPFLLYSFNVC